MLRIRLLSVSAVALLSLNLGCQKKPTDTSAATGSGRYLYFAGGACYSGGLTASKPSSISAAGLINRIDVETAQMQGMPIMDYNSVPSYNYWPVGIVNYDNDHMLVALESTASARTIHKVKKNSLNSGYEEYTNGGGAFNGVLRNMKLLTDGSLMISKSTGIEKFNANKIRLPSTSTTFITALGGSCATSATNLSAIVPLPNGMTFVTHANTGQNRAMVIGATGYNTGTTTDCKSAVNISSPSALSFPTAAVLIPNTVPYQVLVSYSAAAAANDGIYLFTVNETTGALTAVATGLYTDTSYARGVTAMTFDETTNKLYVANGTTTFFNTIEKFSYDSNAQTLVRDSTFMLPQTDTQCINSMFVGN